MVKPRTPTPTVTFVDTYCQHYQFLFSEVRSYEAFKQLHVGLISDIKRKTLPAIAKVLGLRNQQGLHHFLSHSPWQAEALRERRLSLILRLLNGRPITLIVDESGDPKKGTSTDYVKRQYLSNLGKIDNGIVVVTVYGLIEEITIPLLFEVYKPRERLNAGDQYQTKTMLAAKMVHKLQRMGFNIDLVLADSLYGESSQTFLRTLEALGLPYVVSIRSNHGVWLPEEQRVRRTSWRPFKRIFSNGESEVRWIREVIFGQRRARRYWEVQTEEEHHSGQGSSYVMTRVEGISYQQVGNYYGLRTWVEYGLRQSKSELGWSDFRMTDYQQIEKWWELVMSAYLMVSLHSSQLSGKSEMDLLPYSFRAGWNQGRGWKNILNNLRLVLQPFSLYNLIKPWLEVFELPELARGFRRLIAWMNRFIGLQLSRVNRLDLHFSSV